MFYILLLIWNHTISLILTHDILFLIPSIIPRTKQGPFELDDDSVHILLKEEWSPENIYNAVEQGKERLKKLKMEEKDLE